MPEIEFTLRVDAFASDGEALRVGQAMVEAVLESVDGGSASLTVGEETLIVVRGTGELREGLRDA